MCCKCWNVINKICRFYCFLNDVISFSSPNLFKLVHRGPGGLPQDREASPFTDAESNDLSEKARGDMKEYRCQKSVKKRKVNSESSEETETSKGTDSPR